MIAAPALGRKKSSQAIGGTLTAIERPGVAALEQASRNGLGKLLKPMARSGGVGGGFVSGTYPPRRPLQGPHQIDPHRTKKYAPVSILEFDHLFRIELRRRVHLHPNLIAILGKPDRRFPGHTSHVSSIKVARIALDVAVMVYANAGIERRTGS